MKDKGCISFLFLLVIAISGIIFVINLLGAFAPLIIILLIIGFINGLGNGKK